MKKVLLMYMTYTYLVNFAFKEALSYVSIAANDAVYRTGQACKHASVGDHGETTILPGLGLFLILSQSYYKGG